MHTARLGEVGACGGKCILVAHWRHGRIDVYVAERTAVEHVFGQQLDVLAQMYSG